MSNSLHIIYAALENAVYEAIDAGTIDPEELDGLPRSTVFYPEPGEPWDEDDAAAIRAVGESDLAAKISFYSNLLDR
ncbi:hypothetical protein SEA_LUCHADOR_92 [Mycobacterium phage Luchador]|uniref:Uncharacterized protein n=1 Tax=Mycobacterium phage Luchador TaxID=1647300 RepID=A0A0F6WDY3_9CAUD|nr:hypothetical protein AVT52_gp12 [Mycobacterium phage Luchador]AKF14256.1 hypothetical protein SEA_LUCHADOR_92 [Mycobacterium phage Luchador]